MNVDVLIVGLPPAGGCPSGKTWRAAAEFVGSRLVERFGPAVRFEYVDLFTPAMAVHPNVEALVAAGTLAPIVLIDGETQSSGGKLHVSAIERAVAERLAAVPVVPATEELIS
jgi:hypothetical protein